MLHSHLIFSISHPHYYPPSKLLCSSSSSYFAAPSIPHSSVRIPSKTRPCLAQLSEPSTSQEDGPIELPPSDSSSSIFSNNEDPSPLQVATSVLLTGSITIFLFRSLRRRAKRVKELKFRSSGVKKDIKEEALDSLKAMKLTSVEPNSPPSPFQALIGGLAAGVISLILYKFTTTIEAALNRQTMSDNFSVQQITITIRTIINGICYLATFVFGINAVGLVLYSGQLALNSFMEEGSTNEATSLKDDGKVSTTPSINESTDSGESNSTDENISDTQ